MRLTLRKNKFLAIALLATQFVAQTSDELEGTEKLATSMAAAAAAAALQVFAHRRNPDGSDAHEPWKEPQKEK
jgi:hypothetical protein